MPSMPSNEHGETPFTSQILFHINDDKNEGTVEPSHFLSSVYESQTAHKHLFLVQTGKPRQVGGRGLFASFWLQKR